MEPLQHMPSATPPLLRILVDLGEVLCVFFYGAVFQEAPLVVVAFFYSSTLRFLRERFSGTSSCAGEGQGESWFLYGKCYIVARKTPRQKVLFLLQSSSLLRGAGVQSFVGRTSVVYWCVSRG